MRGAEILVRMLIEYDVRTIFGVPGGQTNPIYEAIHDYKDRISHTLFREETNAVFAADAYAKISKKPGVADATLGPGVLRTVPAVAESYNSSIPLILLMGNNPISWLPLTVYRGNASQAVDQIEIMRPITKWAAQITNARSIPAVIRYAFRVATSERPGPVALEVPYNILLEESDANDLYAQREFSMYPSVRIEPELDKIVQVAKLLQESERPVIISGGGVLISDASRELYELAVTFKIPVATTINGKGSFPEIHPLSLGVLGSLGGWEVAEIIVRRADLLIFVGSNVDQITTFDWDIPNKDQKVIHIDIDPVELCRSFSCSIAVLGDAKKALQSLRAKLFEIGYVPKEKWINEVLDIKKKVTDTLAYLNSDNPGTNERLSPKEVMKIINNLLLTKKEITVVADASSSSGWVAGVLVSKEYGRRFLFPRGMAGLGYAIPACIGASIALNELKEDHACLAVAGDGGAAYSIVEIETARRMKIPLVVVILNDSALGWIKKIQEKSGKIYSSTFTEVDFSLIARGLGGRGYIAVRQQDLEDSLKECLNDPSTPCVIDAKVRTAVPYKPLTLYT